MGRRTKLSGPMIGVVVIVGIIGIYFLDRNVLKGQLKISGYINQLIGQIKKLMGQGAGPITVPSFEEGGADPGEPMSPEEMEEQLAEDMAIEREHMARFPD
jgi:hypothetical protein